MVEGIQRIAVVGGGVMGNGIAQVATQAGFETTIVDVSDQVLERARANIDRSLARLVKAGSLTDEQSREVRGRLTTTTDIEAAGREADHVIEAVSEDLDLKQLLAMDPRPGSVAYYRRHPDVVAPRKGRLLLGVVLIIRRILNGHPGYVH